ncbi:MAG: hypothetical protein NVSMB9_23060 [Isosphaeraceae bacterium]
MQWEYRRLATVESTLDETLHELGIEGWELISIMPEARLFHGFQCVLKRPYEGVETARRLPSSIPARMTKFLSTRQ